MLIEQPPFIYRLFFPAAKWRFHTEEKAIYLTFDDGPIPEITPWVLDLLDRYQIKATFFCVGDNVRKHPDIYRQILDRGHRVGNHTFHHLQALKTRTANYQKDVEQATQYIDSPLFRPPHGHLRIRQFWKLRKQFSIVMWDVVTRDYSKYMNVEKVVANVKKYTRNGSVIVFHDSIKAEERMKKALPQAIEWLLSEGYGFRVIGEI
ncbi:MAG: polysaccharide deacetylase family protein [Dysgonamonadaceae bacterium]|jgi:peptidoglycan/xylan/chitin deacetylase (PgdA/CDA1 family)|nr:polysaccharide deacetylase family protein [Dysgonamonadaceae bacterium]